MTAATVLVGCATDPGDDPADPGPRVAVTTCGTQLCMDLNDALNVRLTNVDGTATIAAGGDSILLVRTTPTQVLAISNICTHAGCTVAYDRTNRVLNCPCHGSQFSLTGAVLRGPAQDSLQRYTTQLDEMTNQLTITV